VGSYRTLSAPVVVVLFMAAVGIARSQSGGAFDYYYSGAGIQNTGHTIFAARPDRSGTFKPGQELAMDLSLTKHYDSLFKENPDDFEWDVSGNPPGSYFNPAVYSFFWKPKTDQTGDFLVKVRVRYKSIVDSAFFAIRIEEKWTSSLIPGASYALYAPVASDKYGTFSGVSMEYLLVSWVARNDNRGPSHGRVYIRFELLNSSKPDVPASFLYTTGLNLSLERNPRRSYLIPFFGIEFGGIYNQKWDNIAHFTPVAGVWLYANQTNTVNAAFGYSFPGTSFGELRGWRASLGGTFSLW